jgi:hypothetical protein
LAKAAGIQPEEAVKLFSEETLETMNADILRQEERGRDQNYVYGCSQGGDYNNQDNHIFGCAYGNGGYNDQTGCGTGGDHNINEGYACSNGSGGANVAEGCGATIPPTPAPSPTSTSKSY